MGICRNLFWLGSVAALSGCAGVPQLYKPSSANPDFALAPKVEHIIDRITCEVADASRDHFAGKEYIVTVVLTLQVNDELSLTPSLAFIDVFKNPATNKTVTQNTGIWGSRERLFTSTFTYNSKTLAEQNVAGCDAHPKKLYRLDGDLGIAAIVRDGVGIGARQAQLGHGPPSSSPSFASQVKFIVTRSVSALGPTWTLVSFKGPGGASGLFNGKALTTDTLSIAFAEKKPDPPALATKEQLAELIAAIRALETREQVANALVQKRRLEYQLQRVAEIQKNSGPQPQSILDKQRAERLVAKAALDLREAKEALAGVAGERARAVAGLDAANAVYAASSQLAWSQEEAMAIGQNLITTMTLQTLNVQPR